MKYRPTEYVVDFGDYRSDNFARLNIALIKSNGAKLNESIVRCRDCINYTTDELGDYCTLMDFEDVKSMADMFCAWGEHKKDNDD